MSVNRVLQILQSNNQQKLLEISKKYLKTNRVFEWHAIATVCLSLDHASPSQFNQIYLVTFMCLTVDTSFIFTKKMKRCKMVF